MLKRPIYIDGCNVAKTFGQDDKLFSCKGLGIVTKYFVDRGHRTRVIIPDARLAQAKSGHRSFDSNEFLEILDRLGVVIKTPSTKKNPMNDDEFLIEHAINGGGIILSNDDFDKESKKMKEWAEFLASGVLKFSFDGDNFTPAPFPLSSQPDKDLTTLLLCPKGAREYSKVKANQLSFADQKKLSEELDRTLNPRAETLREPWNVKSEKDNQLFTLYGDLQLLRDAADNRDKKE